MRVRTIAVAMGWKCSRQTFEAKSGSRYFAMRRNGKRLQVRISDHAASENIPTWGHVNDVEFLTSASKTTISGNCGKIRVRAFP